MKEWFIEMWDNLLWKLCLVRRSQALHTQSEMKAALDWNGTLQRQLAALQEQVKQEHADRIIKASYRHLSNSLKAKKGWKTRKARMVA